ncbi:hypothetical protein [Companilactobacillus halodurans]|uniref:Lipoprotein n=1 Tax=Companilactobacillus halodurans TaxID=2584183 RepID=A0A5P0ZR73_9LACO|nr:hypothetical protein [Companilactobacillus halodurans]MQS76565.1 hypothetical protein [Companilactobacillus halodurans]MQS98548.1 hypothetical protein [Companilactobacillus halodurans]
MKIKKILLVFLFVIFALAAGCQHQNKREINQTEQAQLVKKNREVWNKKVKSSKKVQLNAPNDDIVSVPSGYDDTNMSLSRLKNGNQYLVKAKVMNLQPEWKRPFTPETKASIFVEKVISGDKSIQNSTIKTEFSGGLSTAEYCFNDIEGRYLGEDFGIDDPKTVIYMKNQTEPMPKIGSTVILGLEKFRPDDKYHEKLYKKYGLTKENFFTINNPEVTYWIKKHGRFKLNNPAFYQKENRNSNPNIFKLTKKLNEKYL